MKGKNKLKEYTEIWYVSTITDIFDNKNKINICKYTVITVLGKLNLK